MRHAYMILAHNEFGVLNTLLSMLDHPNNDLYIHIDQKVKDFPQEAILASVRNAAVTFVPRISITWGKSPMVDAELILMEHASRTHHDYYHLLSGVDLPIKTHEQIERVFEENRGKEFVFFSDVPSERAVFELRTRYFYFHFPRIPFWLDKRLRHYLLLIQKMLHLNRSMFFHDPFPELQKGYQWFSLTHEAVRFILEQMQTPLYRHMFFASNCPDELFTQTILHNSPFRDRCIDSYRFTEWQEGAYHPETFTMADWPKLESSDCLFARKFSEAADAALVRKVWETWHT